MPAFTRAHGLTSLGRHRSSSRVLKKSVSISSASVLFIWSISFIWFVLFVWLNSTNQMNKTNQRNQIDQTNQRDQRNQMNQINRILLGPSQRIMHNLLGLRDDRL